MTHKQLRYGAICLTIAIGLSGCGAGGIKADTPAQAMVGLRSVEIATAKAFNAYSAQPWCGGVAVPAPPLCAERSVVIEGANLLAEVDTALDAADKVIAAAGVSDAAWAEVANVKKLLERFRAFVGLATGGK